MSRSWSEWDAKWAIVWKERTGKSSKRDSTGSRSRLETIATRESYSTWAASLSEIFQAAGIESEDGHSRATTAVVLTVSAMESDKMVPVLCLQVFEPMSTVLSSTTFAVDAVAQTSALQPSRTRLLATLLGELMASWQQAELELQAADSAES